MDAARVPIRFRHLFRNYVSLAGGLIAGIGFGTNIFLILVDILNPSHNPYVGIVTYMLLPGITVSTSPTDYYPIQAVQLARFKGQTFELFGDILHAESS